MSHRIAWMIVSLSLMSLSLMMGAARATERAHTMLLPAEMTWGEAPPSLPAGAKMAVLYGDPNQPGPFILRAKLPARYKIPAHWHPTDENVTVISGTLRMGMADKLDPEQAKAFPAGSFISMPAKTNHFVMTQKETIIEVSAVGPFMITYVNPDDDPRQDAAGATKK